MPNHRPRQTLAGDVTRPLAMLGRPLPTAQSEDTPPVHNEAFVRLVLRAHVQQIWAKSTVLAHWPWLRRSLIGYAREVAGGQAGRPLCCWILKLERLPVRSRETSSQGRGTGKAKACESQQKRDLRWATIRKAECASPKARGDFEQESEQKRQQGMAAIASEASFAAFDVVQV